MSKFIKISKMHVFLRKINKKPTRALSLCYPCVGFVFAVDLYNNLNV